MFASAIDLTSGFEPTTAILGGVVGAAVMLAPMIMGRAAGMTSMDLLATLGTMVRPDAPTATARGIGLAMHLMMGAVFGIAHATVLTAIAPTTSGAAVAVSVGLGAAHGALVATAMPMMLATAHPLVASGDLPRPGAFMTGFGGMTPMGMLVAHVVFGVVAGAIYV